MSIEGNSGVFRTTIGLFKPLMGEIDHQACYTSKRNWLNEFLNLSTDFSGGVAINRWQIIFNDIFVDFSAVDIFSGQVNNENKS